MKENVKKILLILFISMILISNSFLNCVHAAPNSDVIGGKLFEPISDLICSVGDLVIAGLQDIFMGIEKIHPDDGRFNTDSGYAIKYSPGVIFSGKVGGLDVNFINPNTYETITGEDKKWKDCTEEMYDLIGLDKNDKDVFNEDEYNKLSTWLTNNTTNNSVSRKTETITWGLVTYDVEWTTESFTYDDTKYRVSFVYGLSEENNWIQTLAGSWAGLFDVLFESHPYKFDKEETVQNIITQESSAKQLQGVVASWYKTLRAVALVGLLSVLVYVGIRIIISSTSQEKAKYKNMIKDWLVAICILFILQYIMVFTLEITESIVDMLDNNVADAEGNDVLISDLRNDIAGSDHFSEIFPETIMYVTLVIFTVTFTFQYLKRLLYMAFFTLISPLIALTYPIDKVKDGQAQAFTMWVREYVFNALLQPMHLLLYYIFVQSANDLVDENVLYAVVAIGFLVPAEKFFRKMFGFDKATSAGQFSAAAGGALVMNAINKMGHKSGKTAAGKNGGSDSSGGSSGTTTPRYISNPAGNNGGGSGGGPGGGSSGGPGGGSGGTTTVFGQTVDPGATKQRRSFGSGAKTLAGHYINRGNGARALKAAGRGIRKGAIGALGAATLGTVGLAAGVASGDLGKALQYGATGLGAGFVGANYLGDKATGLEKQNREIYKEGALGTTEYNTRNSVRELTQDNDFNRVCRNLGVTRQKDREALIRQFHSNGITNSQDIKKAMNVRAGNSGTTQDQIIAAQKIRQQAKQYGLKRKDIEDTLEKNGIARNSPDFNKAMNLIDQL